MDGFEFPLKLPDPMPLPLSDTDFCPSPLPLPTSQSVPSRSDVTSRPRRSGPGDRGRDVEDVEVGSETLRTTRLVPGPGRVQRFRRTPQYSGIGASPSSQG